jgi:hypothetical protein
MSKSELSAEIGILLTSNNKTLQAMLMSPLDGDGAENYRDLSRILSRNRMCITLLTQLEAN